MTRPEFVKGDRIAFERIVDQRKMADRWCFQQIFTEKVYVFGTVHRRSHTEKKTGDTIYVIDVDKGTRVLMPSKILWNEDEIRFQQALKGLVS